MKKTNKTKKTSKITDKHRIDFLQALTGIKQYTGKVTMRMSSTGRGWRLHETDSGDGVESVRDALDRFMHEYSKKLFSVDSELGKEK